MNFSDFGNLVYVRGFFETSTLILRADKLILVEGDFFRRVVWEPEGEFRVLTSPLRLVLDGRNAVVEYKILGYIPERDCQMAELTSYIRK